MTSEHMSKPPRLLCRGYFRIHAIGRHPSASGTHPPSQIPLLQRNHSPPGTHPVQPWDSSLIGPARSHTPCQNIVNAGQLGADGGEAGGGRVVSITLLLQDPAAVRQLLRRMLLPASESALVSWVATVYGVILVSWLRCDTCARAWRLVLGCMRKFGHRL